MKYTINELANSKGVSPLVREALLQMEAELDATNRQVEILSDALAESRREVAALKAVQEPVATLWQHGETGRTRITMPGDITDCDARWFKAADLYTTPPAQPESVQEPVLQDIEQYRLQMAGICTAAIGYWKEGDGILPDYDTLALRDVAKLYAKYDELYKAAQAEQEADKVIIEYHEATIKRLEANQEVLMNALWKACGDDGEVVSATIESQARYDEAIRERAIGKRAYDRYEGETK